MVENKQLFVADASVIYKWAVEETNDAQPALLFKDDFVNKKIHILVPVFCFTEICNALGLKYPEIAMNFFSQLLILGLDERQVSFDVANIAFQLMQQYDGITFYDASYHALAIHENATFITADGKYYKKAKKEGRIMLLKDYGKKR